MSEKKFESLWEGVNVSEATKEKVERVLMLFEAEKRAQVRKQDFLAELEELRITVAEQEYLTEESGIKDMFSLARMHLKALERSLEVFEKRVEIMEDLKESCKNLK